MTMNKQVNFPSKLIEWSGERSGSYTPYSMSKFAATAFAHGLRREMVTWRVRVHI